MSRFVFYLRTREGHIERLGNMITEGTRSILGSYQYEEPLTGFPEHTVFWANDEGVSVGLALLVPTGLIL
jgi:hypothetical protein